MNTGFEFIKKLRPIGCVIVVLCLIGFLAVCFTSGKANEIEGYTPAHETEYYAEHADELLSELESEVFPHLDGIVSSGVEDGRVKIKIESPDFIKSRSVLLHYFDETLLELKESGK